MGKNNDLTTLCDELILSIEDGCSKAREKRRFIKQMKSNLDKKENISFSFIASAEPELDTDLENSSSNSKFEDLVSLYLPEYKSLGENCTIDDILEILPSRNSNYFKDLIYRLKAESLREINDLKSLDLNDNSLSKEDLEYYNSLINTEKNKINLLSQILSLKDENITSDDVNINHLVLVPTSGGNIRIIEDLKHIASEYYPGFYEIINSIVTGEFQGLRKIVNNDNIEGIYEGKGFKVRVLFSRLDSNHYALIGCFVKKVDSDNYYLKNIGNISSSFKKQESQLIKNLNNDEFMKLNDSYVDEMFRILGVTDNKEFVKGGLNG